MNYKDKIDSENGCCNHNDVGLVLRSINNILMRATIKQAKNRGIDGCTIMHGWILSYLIEHKNTDIYQRDIEKKFLITRSAVTATVKNMEKKGYIKRLECEHDARLKKLVITPTGEEIHNRMVENFIEVDKKLIKGIDMNDYQTFIKVCNQIKNNLHSLL